MKKIYTFFTLLLISFPSFSQITLTDSFNAPKAGNTLVYMELADTSFKEGAFGKNQTWNFSRIIAAGKMVKMKYFNAAATPFHKVFPTAKLALYDSVSATYTYYHRDTSGLIALGTGTSLDTTKYLDSERVSLYPLSYNTFSIDSFQYNKPKETFNGVSIITADAYGIARLPTYTDSQVLRVQTIETIKTIVFTSTGTDTSRLTTTTYSFYLAHKKWPVIQIVYRSEGGNTLKSVRYYPGTTPTGIEDLTASLTNARLYPNPSDKDITISVDLPKSGNLQLDIYNTLGEKVRAINNSTVSNGQHTFMIDKGSLSRGIYLVNIKYNSGSEMKKLVIE